MLMQFTVANFLSFDEEQTFSMLAAEHVGADKHPSHVITDPNGGPALVRAAAIYGANASGKSNLVKAIDFARQRVMEGTRPNQPIPVTTFKLRPEAANEPSKFSFVVRLEGVQYEYGFLADRHRVHEEWLFQTRPGVKEEMLFQRATDEVGKVEAEFGEFLTKTVDSQFWNFLAMGTRPNQLILSEVMERNQSANFPILTFFGNGIITIDAEQTNAVLESLVHNNKETASLFSEFLNHAGTGITGITTSREKLDLNKLSMSDDIAREFIRFAAGEVAFDAMVLGESGGSRRIVVHRLPDGSLTQVSLRLNHQDSAGNDIAFDVSEESEGTQRLVNLLTLIPNLLLNEVCIVIDEIDRRLHPFLSQMFLETALAVPDGEVFKSQIIFTTHETRLLHPALLRKDEIWFTEKEKTGATKLYSLAEYAMPDDLSWEKGYLNGRFGAIPFVTTPLDLRAEGFGPSLAESVLKTTPE